MYCSRLIICLTAERFSIFVHVIFARFDFPTESFSRKLGQQLLSFTIGIQYACVANPWPTDFIVGGDNQLGCFRSGNYIVDAGHGRFQRDWVQRHHYSRRVAFWDFTRGAPSGSESLFMILVEALTGPLILSHLQSTQQ